jgi:hypothetical protein
MTSKVVLDTCVLVSASVYGSYQDLGVKLEHEFYTKTVPLFNIIKKYVDKRIGIITFTIETQAIAVIANAVTGALEEQAEKIVDTESRAKLFESHTVFFDQCLAHLQDNLSILQREPLVQSEKFRYYSDVTMLHPDTERQYAMRFMSSIRNAISNFSNFKTSQSRNLTR